MAERMGGSDPAWPAFEAQIRREMAANEAERNRLLANIEAIKRTSRVLAEHLGKGLDELVAEGLLSAGDAQVWDEMMDELRASGALDRILGGLASPVDDDTGDDEDGSTGQ